jgi:RNA polymerase sigma-70 factor (ECF subfamily)
MEFFPFDDEYVRRLRDGDRLTEDHFVSYFTPILRIKVRSRLRSPEATDDVVQETLFRVFRMLHGPEGSGIRNGHSFGAYVLKVCDHVIFEWIRGERRVQPIDDDDLVKLITSETREDELIKEQRRECVRRVVGGMDTRERKILTAIFFEEKPKEDVCEEFGVSHSYLRVLLHRAGKKFRKAWEKEQKAEQTDPDETDPTKPSLPN